MIGFIINWLIASFINGLFFFIVFVGLLYWFYLKELPVSASPVHQQFEDVAFSTLIKEMMEKNKPDELNGDSSSVIALNMLFQFLFQELKDTKGVRRYIIRKMTAEFKELLTTKAAGKLIQRITAKDFSLGTSFPIINSIKLNSYEMDKAQKTIQELSLIVDLEYKNGFSISVDADLIFGRSAYVHIKIAYLKGKARLQFTRSPFTHWNFSFIEEPKLEFAASSHLDGRQIPQLTTLILNQLRRSVRRKHTLPNYKCRFKPFFDAIYNQSLYKTHIDEILKKKNLVSESSVNDVDNPEEEGLINSNPVDVTDNIPNNLENLLLKNKKTNDQSFQKLSKKVLAEINSVKKIKSSSIVNNLQYRKLCEKLGCDLTSVGQLTVTFKFCDRLPEALYSLNLPQIATVQPQTASSAPSGLTSSSSATSLSQLNQQTTQSIQKSTSNNQIASIQDHCVIYLTYSLDSVSMKSLMEKQISKDSWPLLEFDIVRSTQSLGIGFTETFFINKNEVVIQKIVPNSLAAQADLRIFDIVFSINQTRISSFKQLNKIIQKCPLNSTIKILVQRPCVIVNKPIITSSTVLPVKKEEILTQVPSDNSSSSTTPEPTEKVGNTVQSAATIPSGNTNSTSSSIVSNTRLKLERLEQKLKFSFGSNLSSPSVTTSSPSSLPNNPVSVTSNDTNSDNNSIQKTSQSNGQTLNPTNTNSNQIQFQQVPSVTHTTSSSNLVEYFCNLSECSTSEPLVCLDLIGLLMNSIENDNENTESNQTDTKSNNKRNKNSFFRTRDIKLDKENLLSFNNVPIQIDELKIFDLNSHSKYLNIYLWTVQYTNKMARWKNLLLGYITIPMHEVSVDCWNTSKGETQSTVHFQPLDELKASAISRLTKSHVISDHPGFDSKLSVGTLTLNFQHVLDSHTNEGEQISVNSKDTRKDSLSSQTIANKIGDELVEQNLLETDLNKKLAEGALEEDNDDGSIHKFVNVQFNENVFCKFCNKKIWFKNAYQCAYCGYIIHLKCYEKCIEKSTCDRFFKKYAANSTNSKEQIDNNELINGDSSKKNLGVIDDSFVVLSSPEIDLKMLGNDMTPNPKRSSSPSQMSILSNTSEHGSSSSSRSLVSNFFSGIRHRKNGNNNNNSENQNLFSNGLTSLKSNGFLSTFNLTNKYKSRNNNSINNESANSSKRLSNESTLSKNSDDNSSIECDEFKDVDTNEDKLFGTDLFDELPLEERRLKFEETIQKYQSTIDMMTKLKSDLESELNKSPRPSGRDQNGRKKDERLTHQEEQIKLQVKHLDDQIKCVVFLLMQCQIGLENINDTNNVISDNFLSNENDQKQSEAATEAPPRPPPPITAQQLCVEQISIPEIVIEPSENETNSSQYSD